MNDIDWRQQFPLGSRVRIIGDHYHAGKTGIVTRHGYFRGEYALQIMLDNHKNRIAGVRMPENLEVIT